MAAYAHGDLVWATIGIAAAAGQAAHAAAPPASSGIALPRFRVADRYKNSEDYA